MKRCEKTREDRGNTMGQDRKRQENKGQDRTAIERRLSGGLIIKTQLLYYIFHYAFQKQVC